MTVKINLSEIRIDGGTQSRVELNQDVVAEYADAYAAGKRLPDISLFFDGTTYWLADGFHRYFGAKKAGKTSIDAESKDGTQRDAWLYSLGANAEHGLQRTNADKRKAVFAAFDDAELGQWTARQIAEACAVSHTYVNRLRDEREAKAGGNVSTTKPVSQELPKKEAQPSSTPATEPAHLGAGTSDAAAGVEPDDDGAPSDAEQEKAAQDIAIRDAAEAKARERLAFILIDEDDPLNAVMAENLRLSQLLAVAESRIAGLQGENGKLITEIKKLQRKSK